MRKSTGIAFSSSLPVQSPAPKLPVAPSISRPQPSCCVLRTSIAICSSEKSSRGTLASSTASYCCSSASPANDSPLGRTVTSIFSRRRASTIRSNWPRCWPSSITSTCPLPRTWAKPEARLFCWMALSSGRKGMKRAV